MPKSRRLPLNQNPFFAIGVMILVVFLASEAFFLATSRKRPLPGNVTYPDPTARWQTYTNKTEGYSFQYPPVINGPATIRDDLVEIYEEVEGLVLLIDRIAVPDSPAAWLRTQTKDLYSQKPLGCFSQQEVWDIPSVASPGATLLHFATPVLFLDNIESVESKRGRCADIPRIRVMLLKHRDILLKITFSGTPLSERMLATLRFMD